MAWSQVLVTIAGIGVAFALLGVGAELVARILLRRSGYYVWQRHYRRLLHLEPGLFPQLEQDVTWEVNADGERGGPAPQGPGVFRVLLLGGSTVESALCSQDTCWSGRLEALLNEAEARRDLGATRVHVGNVGRSGVDARGVGQILERTLPRYPQIDAVGIMVGPGDLMRWLEDGAPADRLPAPLPATTCFAESPELPLGWHPKRLALTEAVRRLRMRVLRPLDVREKAARWMGRARKMRQSAERFITEVPAAQHFLDRFERDVDEAVQRAKSRAATVALIRQPSFRKSAFPAEEEAMLWNGGVGNAFRGDVQTVFFSTEVMYALLDQMDERMRAVAARHAVAMIDPMPALTMSAAVFFDHFHLSPLGADELARCIAAELRRLRAR